MYFPLRTAVVLTVSVITVIECTRHHESSVMETINRKEFANGNLYEQLVYNISQERLLESILIMQRNFSKDLGIDKIYKISIPKIIITSLQTFSYTTYFSSGLLAILILEGAWDKELLESMALTLNYMRQSRVMVIVMNVEEDIDDFTVNLLQSCRKYKMTNVLLLLHMELDDFVKVKFLMLKPYPNYHWHHVPAIHQWQKLYPQHWMNMQNTTIMTLNNRYVDEASSLLIHPRDAIKYVGIAPNLVILMADTFNATLKLLYALKRGEVVPRSTFVNLTQQGLVNVPMSVHTAYQSGVTSYPLLVDKTVIIMPYAKRLPVKDVFSIVITKSAFAIVVLLAVLFSILHSAIDYISQGRVNILDFLMNSRVIPGIMGQSFVQQSLPLMTLKILYILIFVLGVYLNTGYSAYLQTLVTSPPFHHQLQTFEDLKSSSQKILVDTHDDLLQNNAEKAKLLETALVFTTNTSYVADLKNELNATYGFILPVSLWQLYDLYQSFFGQKLFRIPVAMNFNDHFLTTIALEENSPYKEPLDYLIHQVNSMGLLQQWYTRSVLNMVKRKPTALLENLQPQESFRYLKVDDLSWIWLAMLIGWTSSLMAFVSELFWFYIYSGRKKLPCARRCVK